MLRLPKGAIRSKRAKLSILRLGKALLKYRKRVEIAVEHSTKQPIKADQNRPIKARCYCNSTNQSRSNSPMIAKTKDGEAQRGLWPSFYSPPSYGPEPFSSGPIANRAKLPNRASAKRRPYGPAQCRRKQTTNPATAYMSPACAGSLYAPLGARRPFYSAQVPVVAYP